MIEYFLVNPSHENGKFFVAKTVLFSSPRNPMVLDTKGVWHTLAEIYSANCQFNSAREAIGRLKSVYDDLIETRGEYGGGRVYVHKKDEAKWYGSTPGPE